MGIPGLLKQLKSITNKRHISHFKGLKIGIDAHCWLHRGAYACAREVSQGLFSDKFVRHFLDLIALLLANGIDDIVVIFDGASLPMKNDTNTGRATKRQSALEFGLLAESLGDHTLAYTHFQNAISITSDMVHQLIARLKASGIRYLVSPYESDAQLAFLSQAGIIDVVISEDSDTLVYGCKQVFFKMDSSGNGDHICRCDLADNREISFLNWNDDQFKLFCCLSGCDYMEKLRNIGLKTAYKIVNKHKSFMKVCNYLRSSPLYDFDDNSAAQLERAMLTFKHQTVYNLDTSLYQPLTPLPAHTTKASGLVQRGFTDDVSFLGPILDKTIGIAVATGAVDPNTLCPFDNNEFTSGINKKNDTVQLIRTKIESMSVEEKKTALYGNPGTVLTEKSIKSSIASSNELKVLFSTSSSKGKPSIETSLVANTEKIFPAHGTTKTANAVEEDVSWSFNVNTDASTSNHNANDKENNCMSSEYNCVLNQYESLAVRSIGGYDTTAKRKRTRKTVLSKSSVSQDFPNRNSSQRQIPSVPPPAVCSSNRVIWCAPNESTAGLSNPHAFDNNSSTKRKRVNEEVSLDKLKLHQSNTFGGVQFVSPLVSSKFMTLNRRHGRAAPLTGVGVNIRRHDAHSSNNFQSGNESVGYSLKSSDEQLHFDFDISRHELEAAASVEKNSSVLHRHSQSDELSQRFFEDQLFNTSLDDVAGVRSDLTPALNKEECVVSAATRDSEILCGGDSLHCSAINTKGMDTTLNFSGVVCPDILFHDDVVGLNTNSNTNRHGIFIKSPVIYKSPQQLEAELHFTDTSLGDLSPSLPANRLLYDTFVNQGNHNVSQNLHDNSLIQGYSSRRPDHLVPVTPYVAMSKPQSLWDEIASSHSQPLSASSGSICMRDHLFVCSSNNPAGRHLLSRPETGGFSAYYLPQRSRGVFPQSQSEYVK